MNGAVAGTGVNEPLGACGDGGTNEHSVVIGVTHDDVNARQRLFRDGEKGGRRMLFDGRLHEVDPGAGNEPEASVVKAAESVTVCGMLFGGGAGAVDAVV